MRLHLSRLGRANTQKKRTPRAKFTHHTRCKLLLLLVLTNSHRTASRKQQQYTTAASMPVSRGGALAAKSLPISRGLKDVLPISRGLKDTPRHTHPVSSNAMRPNNQKACNASQDPAGAYARPTNFSLTSHNFTALPSSATSSDTWFSKAPANSNKTLARWYRSKAYMCWQSNIPASPKDTLHV